MSAYPDTDCPECGGPMVSRKRKSDGQVFWGCRKFPDCKGTRNTDGEARREGNRFEQSYDERHQLPTERALSNDRSRWRNQS